MFICMTIYIQSTLGMHMGIKIQVTHYTCYFHILYHNSLFLKIKDDNSKNSTATM